MSSQHGLTTHPAPLNNHIYVAGQVGYQNNSAPADYNPDQARKDLDAHGLEAQRSSAGEGRQTAGRSRRASSTRQSNRQIAMVAQNSLAQIGVKLVLDPKPGNGFFSQYVGRRRLRHRSIRLGGQRFPVVRAAPDIHLGR